MSEIKSPHDFSIHAAEEVRGDALLCAYLLLMKYIYSGDLSAETEAQVKALSPGTLEELGMAYAMK
jgi:hypothetical protein